METYWNRWWWQRHSTANTWTEITTKPTWTVHLEMAQLCSVSCISKPEGTQGIRCSCLWHAGVSTWGGWGQPTHQHPEVIQALPQGQDCIDRRWVHMCLSNIFTIKTRSWELLGKIKHQLFVHGQADCTPSSFYIRRLMRGWQKVESEKVGLKLNIQKMKIMASGPTTSWEIDGETVETDGNSVRLYFLGLQNHCRWWLQPRN